MEYRIENDTLSIKLNGELNSYNSEDVEREIDEAIAKKGFSKVRIDMNDLVYISSAGLRIIVRVKQQFDDTVLTNVPDVVYDVFDMVGFPNLMTIERK